jgi:hypothetical protein
MQLSTGICHNGFQLQKVFRLLTAVTPGLQGYRGQVEGYPNKDIAFTYLSFQQNTVIVYKNV